MLTIQDILKNKDLMLENDKYAQSSLNRQFKKDVSKVSNHIFTPGATVHHLDIIRRDEETNLKITTKDNVVVIDTNTLDANFVHQLIHFCHRHNIKSNQLIEEITKIPIYKFEDDGGYKLLSINEVISITK